MWKVDKAPEARRIRVDDHITSFMFCMTVWELSRSDRISRLINAWRRKAAEKKKATSVQIALTGLLGQKPWIVLIPGTRKLEPLGAVTVELTSEDLHEIDNAGSKITIQAPSGAGEMDGTQD